MQTKDDEFSYLREDWTVAELKVSYKPKHLTRIQVVDSVEAFRVFHKMWDHSLINLQEQFCALFLNRQDEAISFRVISTGQNFTVDIDQKFLYRIAVSCNASSIITAHNHPSGDVEPSDEDEESTRQIRREGKILGIELRDDLILSDTDFYSFADNQNPAFKDELFAGLEEESLSYNSIEHPKNKKTIRLFGLPVFSFES